MNYYRTIEIVSGDTITTKLQQAVIVDGEIVDWKDDIVTTKDRDAADIIMDDIPPEASPENQLADKEYVNVLLETAVPTMLSELSDDDTHRLVTDKEKETWSEKADALVQQNIAAILALSQGTGTTTLTSNPEWKLLLLDHDDRILFGKRQDNSWYMPVDLDELLDFVIADYGVNV